MTARPFDTPEVRAAARARSKAIRARHRAEQQELRAASAMTPEARRLADVVDAAYGGRR